MSDHIHTNRLARETSPYLLQHAHNPVDWYPWGEEAFERARSEGKPIFLSIGYSTCHWCHVMERESFENDATAEVMNELFVNVKVDREEHPDVDQIYMQVVQRMTGQGGWPMSVFLTPDLMPFYAGTYFPPHSMYGRPGFPDLLNTCARLHAEQPDSVREQSERVMEAIRSLASSPSTTSLPERGLVSAAVSHLKQGFDSVWGGFGGAPKFPRSMTLMVLLREALAEAGTETETHCRNMITRTLDRMWRGGMYDHVGGGFARYSTDVQWLVPHFEKMLYDNALLAIAYAEAWQADDHGDWRRVACETLDWVLTEMRHPDGGFFSAQDADSEGEEGLFYVWTPAQLQDVLGADDAAFASKVFGVDAGPNFEGRSILHLPKPLDECAEVLSLSRDQLEEKLADIRGRLYAAREERIHPGLDDKVLASWNGLMIAAMAFCGRVFGEQKYVEAASAAAAFIEENLQAEGGLLRTWRDGHGQLAGTLEDHAFYGWGLLELFQATGDTAYLERAASLTETALERFTDREAGGFFLTEEGREHLIVRPKDGHDGATPSGGSVMVMNLLKLSQLLDRPQWRVEAERGLMANAHDMERYPLAYPYLLCALDLASSAPAEYVVVADAASGSALVQKVRETFAPHAVVIPVKPGSEEASVTTLPGLAGKVQMGGQETVWVCRDFSCRAPATEVSALEL